MTTQPWYRQFWPWFLIVLPGTVVIASLYTVYLANLHADDMVVDDYYKRGLSINRELDRERRAEALAITAELQHDGRVIRMFVTGNVDASQLRLTFSHPMEADRDITIPLAKIAPQIYEGMLPTPPKGYWHWVLDPGAGSDWRMVGEQRF